jgi:single-strand DNA-binding protein
MATNIQHSIIAGRLTKKPELKQSTTEKGTLLICTFTIAVNLGFGDKRYTEFNECVAYGNTAATIARCFDKGDEIYVYCADGWRTREWEDKDGSKHYKMEHKVNDFRFVGSKGAQGDQVSTPTAQTPSTQKFAPPAPNFEATGDEDIPF